MLFFKDALNKLNVNTANGVDIEVSDTVIPINSMEVYPGRFKQTKLLFHAKIKRFVLPFC